MHPHSPPIARNGYGVWTKYEITSPPCKIQSRNITSVQLRSQGRYNLKMGAVRERAGGMGLESRNRVTVPPPRTSQPHICSHAVTKLYRCVAGVRMKLCDQTMSTEYANWCKRKNYYLVKLSKHLY